MYLNLLIAAASFASIGMVLANSSIVAETHWVPLKPEKIEWASEGAAEVNDDHSISLQGSKEWQEFTLFFRLPLPSEGSIARIRVELFPADPSQAQSGNELILFELKPSLKNSKHGLTLLDFESCQFLGNQSDPSVSNCIDHLSDTGWSVPAFEGGNESHTLVLALRQSVVPTALDLFAITLDSGGGPGLRTLSQIRVSIENGEP